MSLIDKMHKMYNKDMVTGDILKSAEKALSVAEDDINDLSVNRFLNYADWELENMERDLGITSPAADVDERRADVRTKLTTREKPTLDGVRSIVKRFLSAFSLKWLRGAYMLYVIADSDVVEAADVDKMTELLRSYVPAHIGIYVGCATRTWAEVNEIGVGWKDLNELTWKEVRENRRI